MNNPLKYTDPTGHFSISNAWNSFKGAVSNAVNTVKSFVSSALKPKPPVNAPLSTFVIPKSYFAPKAVASNTNSDSSSYSQNNNGSIHNHAPKETSNVHRQLYNFVIGDDISTVNNPNATYVQRGLAGISIIGNIYPPGKIGKLEKASKMFDPDQAALIQLAKEAKRTGVYNADADTLLKWADEYNIKPALDHRSIENAAHWDPLKTGTGIPHIRIGSQNHIEVLD